MRPRRSIAVAHAASALAALVLCATVADAQDDDANALAAPTSSSMRLLELGAGLERPPAPTGARLERHALPAAPPPPASDRGTATLPRLAAATRIAPAAIHLHLHGDLAARGLGSLTTDLAYVREVRVDDGGEFVLGGSVARAGAGVRASLSLRRRGEPRQLERSYEGTELGLSRFLHRFADDAVEALTGRRSSFGGRLAFAQRIARGRKDVLVVDVDGGNLERVSSGHGIATLPAFGPRSVFYSVARPTGVFITQSGTGDRPIIGGRRTNMGARVCGGRLYFASSREGNTDIYSAALDGSDERRLTAHAAIDVSPTCAPGGAIAFVSNRRGRPQVFLARDGAEPEQLTHGTTERQTPVLCGNYLAYTEVEDGMRVMLLDRSTGTTTRVSPRGGDHKDPAFSPDCRLLAWAGPRGLIIARRDGHLPRVLVPGSAEGVRWGPPPNRR